MHRDRDYIRSVCCVGCLQMGPTRQRAPFSPQGTEEHTVPYVFRVSAFRYSCALHGFLRWPSAKGVRKLRAKITRVGKNHAPLVLLRTWVRNARGTRSGGVCGCGGHFHGV